MTDLLACVVPSSLPGMNEVAGTIYYVFAADHSAEWSEHAEADAFFCFTHLMAELRDLFIQNMDETDSGIEVRLQTVYGRDGIEVGIQFASGGMEELCGDPAARGRLLQKLFGGVMIINRMLPWWSIRLTTFGRTRQGLFMTMTCEPGRLC
jgi:hypothetical protein